MKVIVEEEEEEGAGCSDSLPMSRHHTRKAQTKRGKKTSGTSRALSKAQRAGVGAAPWSGSEDDEDEDAVDEILMDYMEVR